MIDRRILFINHDCNLMNQMLLTIRERKLISYGDKIVVGLSGGADSVALLMALNALRDRYSLTLVACHVNHKIRHESAECDQRFVEELCASMHIECHVKEAYVEELAKEWGVGTEEAGRKVRYDFFNEIAGENGKIATAHHMNDNVETVLMRFMRGTGLHGLSGIPYKRDNIIRPLLDVSRKEIENFLAEHKCPYVTDETNFEAIYTRNKIRLNLIPEIQREFNSNFVKTLSNNISVYQEEDDFMNQSARKIIDKYFSFDALEGTEEASIQIKKDVFKKEHIAVIKRSLLMTVKESFGVDLNSDGINHIIELGNEILHKNGKSFHLGNDLIVSSRDDNLIIMKDFKVLKNLSVYEVPFTSNGIIELKGLKIKYERVYDADVVNNENVFYLPIKWFDSTLRFRTRRDGDIVSITPYMNKKLKKLFIDKKIPSYQKDNYWLLVSGENTVLWVPTLFGSRLKQNLRTGAFIRFEIVE